MDKYYNTNNLRGEALSLAEDRAGNQENIVQDFFNKHPNQKFTVSDVDYELKKSGKLSHSVPITSVRRAMTNLKKDGRIDKLEETAIRPNGLGSPERYYQLSQSYCRAGYNELQPSDYAQDTHD